MEPKSAQRCVRDLDANHPHGELAFTVENSGKLSPLFMTSAKIDIKP
jgi:hypothetical protein